VLFTGFAVEAAQGGPGCQERQLIAEPDRSVLLSARSRRGGFAPIVLKKSEVEQVQKSRRYWVSSADRITAIVNAVESTTLQQLHVMWSPACFFDRRIQDPEIAGSKRKADFFNTFRPNRYRSPRPISPFPKADNRES
jgi:hypothetical protein